MRGSVAFKSLRSSRRAISDVILWSSEEQQNLDPEEGEEHKKYEDIADNLFEASVRHVPSSFAGDAVKANAQLASQVEGEY
jgi:hypothetical protein